MQNKFYDLKIKEIFKTTPDCSIISFDLNNGEKEAFKFVQGQHLTLKATINNEEIRRNYSICSSPLDGELRVGIKQIPNGVFSTFANNNLKAGDTLEVMPPHGNFNVPVEPNANKNYVAFAAGSGITPILSIIKTHLMSEPNSTFTLFYINKNAGSVILKEEIEALKNQYLNRFKIYHFLTKEVRDVALFDGRIDSEKLDIIYSSLISTENTDDTFICGPEDMIFLIRDYLKDKGFDEQKIHFELFNTTGQKYVPSEEVKAHSGEICDVTVQEGGKKFRFDLEIGKTNILDGALGQAADLPFACKGGVCCTCKAKVLEGKVEMINNYALEQEEVEDGYVLTCQAIPLTDKVVVDFDV